MPSQSITATPLRAPLINFGRLPLAHNQEINVTMPPQNTLAHNQLNTRSPDPSQNFNQIRSSNITAITPPPAAELQRHGTVPWMVDGRDGRKQPNVQLEEVLVKCVYHKGIFDSHLRDSMKLMDVYEEFVDEVCQNWQTKLQISIAKKPVYKTLLNRYEKILKSHRAFRNKQKNITGGGDRA